MTVFGERKRYDNLAHVYNKGEVLNMTIAHFRLSSVDDFIQSLSLPKVASSILKSTRDCELFAQLYWMKNERPIDDLLDFREYKIESENIAFSVFLEKCVSQGLKGAFEDVFLQAFTTGEIKLIHQSITNNKTSLEELYTLFCKNPNINIVRLAK